MAGKKNVSVVYVVTLEGRCPAYVQAENWEQATKDRGRQKSGRSVDDVLLFCGTGVGVGADGLGDRYKNKKPEIASGISRCCGACAFWEYPFCNLFLKRVCKKGKG